MSSLPLRVYRASHDTTDTVPRTSGEAATLAGVTGDDVRAWVRHADADAHRELEQRVNVERSAA